MHTIRTTDFHFSDAQQVYRGKVRDVYRIEDIIIMVATDRISAFDHVLPEPIPYKGQVLNGIAAFFLESTKSIVPNWLKVVPHPNISAGIACQPLPVEMVIRGYLAGHAAREYRLGKRLICDVHLPEGLKEGDPLPHPIITPTTKASEGHDLDISREDILSRGIVSEAHYLTMEKYTYALFEKGTQMAVDRGLLLVDTKYEFGLYNDEVILIDELHTPDSSRYYYSDGYEERQASGEPQKQLSKEFVREWLIQHGFQGKEGQQMPVMPQAFVDKISNRYIELYERITGTSFEKSDVPIDPRSVLSAVNSIQYAG